MCDIQIKLSLCQEYLVHLLVFYVEGLPKNSEYQSNEA